MLPGRIGSWLPYCGVLGVCIIASKEHKSSLFLCYLELTVTWSIWTNISLLSYCQIHIKYPCFLIRNLWLHDLLLSLQVICFLIICSHDDICACIWVLGVSTVHCYQGMLWVWRLILELQVHTEWFGKPSLFKQEWINKQTLWRIFWVEVPYFCWNISVLIPSPRHFNGVLYSMSCELLYLTFLKIPILDWKSDGIKFILLFE